MKRFFIMIIIIIISFLFQSTVFQALALADVVPNIMLIVTVSIGYMRGRKEAMFTGLVFGLIADCMYNDVIGLYGLIYMVIGYLNGYSNKIYYRDDFTMPVILVGISDLVYSFMIYISTFLLRNRLDILYYFFRRMLPELVYTVFISVILYKLLHMLNNRLEKNESGEES